MNSKALQDIATERQRQVAQEGWSEAHDDSHWRGELSRAAASYLLEAVITMAEKRLFVPALQVTIREVWPWRLSDRKVKDLRRNLVRAAALIAAEIERLDRAETEKGQEAGAE